MNPVLRLFVIALAGLSLAVFAACSGGGSAAQDDAAAIVGTVPFEDGEELTYSLHDDDGVIGHGTLTVRREGDNLVLEQRYEEASPPEGEKPTSDSSSVIANATTLQPQSVERIIEGRDSTDRYAGEYAADGTSVQFIETRDDDEPKERELEVPAPSYDNESSLWLWRTLPLSEDYKARYVSVNPVERTRQAVDLEVTGTQRISVPAGTFDTWRLQIRNGRATRIAWINVEAPHQIVQWDNGSTTFRLEAPQ